MANIIYISQAWLMSCVCCVYISQLLANVLYLLGFFLSFFLATTQNATSPSLPDA
jgi:hypothetical protein